MSAQIQFIGQGPSSVIANLAGSGIGFYGSAFGASVAVGAWQQTTYITDSTGTIQGAMLHNTTHLNYASGLVDSMTSGLPLTAIPNYEACVNVRLVNSTAISAQNTKCMVFDRNNINNAASGVHQAIAEIVHPDTNQNNNGSGSKWWQYFSYLVPGSGMVLSASPCTSGIYGGTQNSTPKDTEHDWYLAMSASPDSIGAKMYALYFYTEYL